MKTNWPIKKLGEICELKRGSEPGSKTYNDKGEGIRFIRVADISKQRTSPIWTTGKNLVICKKEDILMTFDGSPGVVFRGIEGAISSGIRIMKPKDGKELLDHFLFYVLQTDPVQNTVKKYTIGVSIWHASKSIPHIEIPLPPLKTQKRIVARIEKLFEKIDKAKGLRQKAQEETDQIFPATLKEMFTDLKKKNCQSERIGNLIENIQTGTTPPSKVKKYYNGNIQWFTPGDLGNSKFLSSSARTITEIALKEGKAKLFKKGTLLFVGIGATLGKIGIASRDVSSNQQITGLYFKKSIIPDFVYYWFIYNHDYICSISPSATLPILNQEGLKDLTMNFPPLSEQKKIVTYLDNLRGKIESLKQLQQNQLEELMELKQSILAKTFKGELLNGKKTN